MSPRPLSPQVEAAYVRPKLTWTKRRRRFHNEALKQYSRGPTDQISIRILRFAGVPSGFWARNQNLGSLP